MKICLETQGVNASVQLKLSIPIGAKVEINPKGFTFKVKAEIEKIFSICPKLLINAELCGLVLAPRLKKGYHQIWEANLQTSRASVSAFINIPTSKVLAFISNLGPNNKPQMLKVGPKFFQF